MKLGLNCPRTNLGALLGKAVGVPRMVSGFYNICILIPFLEAHKQRNYSHTTSRNLPLSSVSLLRALSSSRKLNFKKRKKNLYKSRALEVLYSALPE